MINGRPLLETEVRKVEDRSTAAACYYETAALDACLDIARGVGWKPTNEGASQNYSRYENVENFRFYLDLHCVASPKFTMILMTFFDVAGNVLSCKSGYHEKWANF